MRSVAVVTDSNCGLSPAKAEELGIYMLPMAFLINGELVREGIDITQKEFFERIADENTTISTSQPSPG